MKIKDLKLMMTASGVKDIRYYLNGINVTSRYVVASDGHRLVKVAFDEPYALPDRDNIMAPRESIKAFLAKCTTVPPNMPVEIKSGLYPNQYTLECAGVIEFFTPIDCQRYPSFGTLLEQIAKGPVIKPTYVMQFEWRYLHEAYAGLEAWNKTSKASSLATELHIIEEGLGFGYFEVANVVYIVMSK